MYFRVEDIQHDGDHSPGINAPEWIRQNPRTNKNISMSDEV